jgi:hypothetical protein
MNITRTRLLVILPLKLHTYTCLIKMIPDAMVEEDELEATTKYGS